MDRAEWGRVGHQGYRKPALWCHRAGSYKLAAFEVKQRGRPWVGRAGLQRLYQMIGGHCHRACLDNVAGTVCVVLAGTRRLKPLVPVPHTDNQP